MVATSVPTEVSILAEQDDAPFSISSCCPNGDLDAIFIRRRKDRKRDLTPDPDRPWSSELGH